VFHNKTANDSLHKAPLSKYHNTEEKELLTNEMFLVIKVELLIRQKVLNVNTKYEKSKGKEEINHSIPDIFSSESL
jgi:hypothetical protein